MLRAWRLVREERSEGAFDGEGARLHGGRWNSVGLGAVYAAENRALTALETLLHLPPSNRSQVYLLFPLIFPPEMVRFIKLETLPDGWRSPMASPLTRQVGDAWLRRGESPVLAVPSVIIPAEINFVFNPHHPDFAGIGIDPPVSFAFDPRLTLSPAYPPVHSRATPSGQSPRA
jgi:RES domain-containing protein